MKRLFLIEDTLANKISYWLLACFGMSLPFQRFYSEWLLITFVLHTLIHVRRVDWNRLFHKEVWILSAPFLLNLIALSYSDYQPEGLRSLSHQQGLFLFPVFLSLTSLNLHKYKLQLLTLFAGACTLTIIFLFLVAFRTLLYFNLPFLSLFSRGFMNEHFTAIIDMHPTFLSLYASLSISVFVYLFFHEQNHGRWLYVLLSLILLAGLLQLASRAIVLSTALIGLVVIPVFLLRGKSRRRFWMLSALPVLLAIALITHFDALKNRYIYDLEDDLSVQAITPDLTETRMKRWQMEMGLIQKSPIYGYGTGAETEILKENYFKNHYYRSYLEEFNSHNQYLGFLISTGGIGLLIYLFLLYYGFSISFKRRDFLLLSFLVLVTILSVSDNLLNVNKGIFFYSFFYSLLLLPPNPPIIPSSC